MKIQKKDLKSGEIKLLVDTLEDLWFLSQVIEPGDRVKGKTARKIKVTEEAKASKKTVFLKIEVESVELTESALRVSGQVVEGPEDVSRGSYHTFSLEPKSVVTIIKEEWLSFQLERLQEAEQGDKSSVLVVVFDRESALFALLKSSGTKKLGELQGDVVKKQMETKAKGGFFEQLAKKVDDYDVRLNPSFIVVASPAFWKDELFKVVKDDKLRKKMIPATASGVTWRAVSEVQKRPEVQSALSKQRETKELLAVEEVLKEISKGGDVAYGEKNVRFALKAGAVKTLLISEKFMRKKKQNEKFDEVLSLMKEADKTGGSVMIVSGSHEGAKKLDGIGGIAALLRYNLSFES